MQSGCQRRKTPIGEDIVEIGRIDVRGKLYLEVENVGGLFPGGCRWSDVGDAHDLLRTQKT